MEDNIALEFIKICNLDDESGRLREKLETFWVIGRVFPLWMVYSNARNLDTGLIKRFPLPTKKKINEKDDRVEKLTKETWDKMNEFFDDNRNYIYMSKMRPTLRKIDSLLADFFNLSENQVEYIENYDSKYIWTKT